MAHRTTVAPLGGFKQSGFGREFGVFGWKPSIEPVRSSPEETTGKHILDRSFQYSYMGFMARIKEFDRDEALDAAIAVFREAWLWKHLDGDADTGDENRPPEPLRHLR